MIVFTCKGCGRRHSRPENQAGTLLFCECGRATRVPLDAEMLEVIPLQPVAPAQPLNEVPPAPPLRPTVPATSAVPSRPILDALPVPDDPEPSPLPSRCPKRLLGKIHPDYCFHHDEYPRVQNCEDCRLPFCADCVIDLQGRSLCGPCKNFRVAGLAAPRQTLPLAMVTLVIGCAALVLGLALSLAGVGLYLSEGLLGGTVLMSGLGALPAVVTFVLAGLAWHRLQISPQMRGLTQLAVGATLALVSALWCLTVMIVVTTRHSLP